MRECLFYLLTQAGFSGSYYADVGLRPTADFLGFYRVLIYRLMDGQLSWLLACGEWFRPYTPGELIRRAVTNLSATFSILFS